MSCFAACKAVDYEDAAAPAPGRGARLGRRGFGIQSIAPKRASLHRHSASRMLRRSGQPALNSGTELRRSRIRTPPAASLAAFGVARMAGSRDGGGGHWPRGCCRQLGVRHRGHPHIQGDSAAVRTRRDLCAPTETVHCRRGGNACGGERMRATVFKLRHKC